MTTVLCLQRQYNNAVISMTLLYPSGMLPINTSPNHGRNGRCSNSHSGWMKFVQEDYNVTSADSTLPSTQNDKLYLNRFRISRSVEELSPKMKCKELRGKVKVHEEETSPRSILKKSVSADAAEINELRRLLITDRSQSISLPVQKAQERPPSPKSPQKSVTFADDNNLSLVEVRNFVPSNENFNLWEYSPYFQQHFPTSNSESEDSFMTDNQKIRKKPVELVLCFEEPSDASDFLERFKHRCVALEKCATRDRTVTGIVVVKNIEYHKRVFIRYTMDSWKSSNDTEACYVPNSNDGDTDRFTFVLTLPKSSKELEFAICYKLSTNEFWDNNYNRNYKVQDVLTTTG